VEDGSKGRWNFETASFRIDVDLVAPPAFGFSRVAAREDSGVNAGRKAMGIGTFVSLRGYP